MDIDTHPRRNLSNNIVISIENLLRTVNIGKLQREGLYVKPRHYNSTKQFPTFPLSVHRNNSFDKLPSTIIEEMIKIMKAHLEVEVGKS